VTPVAIDWLDAAAGVLIAALFSALCYVAFRFLHRRFTRLRWKWAHVPHCPEPDWVAVRDGVTWRVHLLARYPAAWCRPDLWFITRDDQKVVCIEEPDRVAAFPTRELAATAAQWCSEHPCACVAAGASVKGWDVVCRVCSNSRVSGMPPGRLP